MIHLAPIKKRENRQQGNKYHDKNQGTAQIEKKTRVKTGIYPRHNINKKESKIIKCGNIIKNLRK